MHSTQCSLNYEVRIWLLRTGTIFNRGWVLGSVTPNPLIGFFLQSQVVSSPACADQYSSEYSRGTLCRSPEFSLCASLSSEVHCPANSSCFALPALLVPVLNSRRLPGCDLVPLPWVNSSLQSSLCSNVSSSERLSLFMVFKVVQHALPSHSILLYASKCASLYCLCFLTIMSPIQILHMYLTELYAHIHQIYTKMFIIAPHGKQPKCLSITL